MNEQRPALCGPVALERSASSSDVIASGSTRVALGGGGVVGCDGGDCEALSSCNRDTGDETGDVVIFAEGSASVGSSEVPWIGGSGFRS